MECKSGESPSSSIDSCTPPAPSTASSGYRPPPPLAAAMRGDLSTDLHLGLSLSCSCSAQADSGSTPSTPRSALTTAAPYHGGGHGRRPSMFVKVYMEGVPIGRKLDLLLVDGYEGLLAQLARMFKASITYPGVRYVLTYQDQEGDWMMVGDVPWELFLTSVKKLRIAKADKCHFS